MHNTHLLIERSRGLQGSDSERVDHGAAIARCRGRDSAVGLPALWKSCAAWVGDEAKGSEILCVNEASSRQAELCGQPGGSARMRDVFM